MQVGLGSSGLSDHSAPRSDPYTTLEPKSSKIHLVETGRSRFLVVSALFSQWKTLVFEDHSRPDGWIMRREIDGLLDPDRAVVGYVLGTSVDLDPITSLKKRLDQAENSYWRLLKENMDLRESLKTSKRKRGK
jgi:hypothetical protein